MIIDITDILISEGKCREEMISVAAEQFQYGGKAYPVSNQPQVAFTFTNAGMGRALIEGKTVICLNVPCDRCLRMVEVPIEIQFTYEAVSLDKIISSGEDLIQTMEEGCFETEDFIARELISQLPSKVLCRKDCRGICTECGQDLNEKECGCDTFIPDPRMAAVKDIFDVYKEV